MLLPAGSGPTGEDESTLQRLQALRDDVAMCAGAEEDLDARIELMHAKLRVLSEDRHRKGNTPNPASSILKIKGSEIQQATTDLLLEVAGPLGLPYQPDHDDAVFGSNEPPMDLTWAAPAAPQYFNYRKVSIYGGSNEIQRNIIAKAVLGF